MGHPDLLVVLAGTAVIAALISLAGTRTERPVAAGVSRVGLVLGSLGGGALIALLDLAAAAVLVAVWDGVIGPAVGAGALPLINGLVIVAVAHAWGTLAIGRRRWARERVPTEQRDR